MRPQASVRLLLLMVLSGLMALPAGASQGSVLDGYSVISADRTSRAVLHVPEKIDLEDLHIVLSGAGRVYGYIFRGTGFDSMSEIEFSDCAQPGCDIEPVVDAIQVVHGFEGGFAPAGDYEIYVLADQAPVSISVTIDSLPDEADDDDRVSVQPVPAEVLTPTTIVNQGENRVYSAGDFSSLETPSLAIMGLWVTSKPHVVTGFGTCTQYSSELESMPNIALSPACPGGSKGVGDNRAVQLEGEDGVMWTVTDWTGVMGLGGWFASVSPPTHSGVRLLFVDLTD